MPKTPQYVLNNQGNKDRGKKHTSASIRMGNSTKKGKAWYSSPARADIIFRRSATAYSL
jgi:hypothetical protein